MFDAGLLAAGISGFPSFYVDEPTGAPFGSPIHLIYQAVTRAGNLGVQSPPELLNQAITAEEALRSLTINAAFSAFEDDVTGSIEVGKRADMAVLYENPLAVEPAAINDIEVYLTVVGGSVHCVVPIEGLCAKPGPVTSSPPVQPELGASASATLAGSSAANAFDGNPDTMWNAGAHPEQWLQFDRGQARELSRVTLMVAQDPAGETIHELWAGSSADDLELVHTFSGATADGDELRYAADAPLVDVRVVRIVTTSSPSWVAWREVVLEPE
jgi:hypothetical protein